MRFLGRKRRKKINCRSKGNKINGFALLLRSDNVAELSADAQT
jgi:hypothetical protein